MITLPRAEVRAAMAEVDAFALANISHEDAHGRPAPVGGPFAARNYLFDTADGSFVAIGAATGNAVVETGIASNHAEGMALAPAGLKLLSDALHHRPGTWVVQVSSAESCPACYAKQLVVHDALVKAGRLKAGQMAAVFGASFEQTRDVAGFNDLPYAISTVARSIAPDDPALLVRHSRVRWADVPDKVQAAFLGYVAADGRAAKLPGFAVAFRPAGRVWPELLAAGVDRRTAVGHGDDVFASAEVAAMRAKCTLDRTRNGRFESWLTPATLFTLTPDPGPLAQAEAMWNSVAEICTIADAPSALGRITPTRESPLCDNHTLFARAAAGYGAEGVGVKVLHCASDNRAQKAWPAVVAAMQGVDGFNAHYDGLGAARGLERHEAAWRARFRCDGCVPEV